MGSPEPDILFSKPANQEQYEIAARLGMSNAVLVQGPPGAGKTHTIANLLGYLLAQGKTVLVTAHTTKALRVLRGQLDEALQPLCLTVLDSDVERQAQLSHAAQEIASRLSRSNASSLRREAAILRAERQKMLKNAVTLRQQLRDARFSEIDEIVLGGEGTSPIEAAKRIKTDVEMDGWIPGPLQPHVLCPLSNDEVFRLYASQGAISPEEEVQLSVQQPAVEKLVSPADFRLLVQEKDGASKRSQSHRKDLWDNRPGKERPSTDLQQLHQRVAATALFLGEPQNWLREVLFAGWTGGGHAQAWEDLIRVIDSLTVAAGDAQTLVMAYGPELPNNVPPPDITTKLADIVRYLERGGVIGFKTRMTKPYGIGGRLIAYTLSGLTAAVSGVVLCSRLMSGQPGAGIGFELDAIAAVVLGGTAITGGRGHIFGTLIGAVTLGVLNNGLNLMEVSPYTQRVIKGAIIVLAIYTSTVKRRD